MNLAQQLVHEVQHVSPDTPPPPTPQASQKLEASLPFSLRSEEANEGAPFERGITTCLGGEESSWAACLASTSDRSLPGAFCESLDRRALVAVAPLLVAPC